VKLVLAGGTGAIGELLATSWHARGHEVVVITRSPYLAKWEMVRWDGRTTGPWASELDGADVVVNLAGRSVNCRYNAANRKAMLDSRVDSTRVLGEAIARAANPPRVWLQSSTATIYEHRYEPANDEATGVLGVGAEAPDTWRFSTDVARAWEAACTDAATPQTRKVLLRSAMVMSPGADGIFGTLLKLARRGLAGPAGDGKQYISWIHGADFINALDFLIARDDLEGIVNVSSPHPLPNAEFMADLRAAARARIGLPATAWMLEVGAFVMRTETELLLKSRRVVPKRLLDAGFTFVHPDWPDAAQDLCRRSA
jgi:uncharacterized protein (TIGR01777 family)